MNKKSKYFLGSIVFVLCVCIGYLLPKLFGDSSVDKTDTEFSDSNIPVEQSNSGNLESSSIDEDSIKDSPTTPEDKSSSGPINISFTEVKKVGNFYTLRVICTNVPTNITLEYEIPDLGQRNADGYFTRIPGRKSGSYEVNVINNFTGLIVATKVVSGFKLIEEKNLELMTSGEFQSLLLNQNDNSLLGGKHPKVARNVALSFEGLRDGDRKPGDILAIREKIAYGIWASARVVRVGYDENGRINSARIQPIYKNE